jgi:hypothetical protein
MPKSKHLIIAAVVGAVTAITVIGTASAEENRRVCGQYYFARERPGGSTGPQYNYSGAFLGKVSKGDTAACQAILDKIATMDPKDLSDNKSIPWTKGDSLDASEMTPCEKVIPIFGPPDPCPEMPVTPDPDNVKIVTFFEGTTS